MTNRNQFSQETQDEILEYVSNELLCVLVDQSFREELKNLFESETNMRNKTVTTLDGEEVGVLELFDEWDFEGRINMDLRFSDEEWTVKRECN